MKHILTCLALILGPTAAVLHSQVSLHAEYWGVTDAGSIHRVYASLPAGASVQSIYAEQGAPFALTAPGGVYQSGGSLLGNGTEIDTQDSWFTIGMPDGATDVQETGGQGWVDALDAFASGAGFSCDDAIGGAFFLFPGSAQGMSADGTVLLGQFISMDTLHLTLNIQWKEQAGLPSTYSEGLSVTMLPEGIGCTDAAASNYDAEALLDDGSCTWPAVSFDGLEWELSMASTPLSAPTYRIYARVLNPNEGISNVYGTSDAPLLLSTTTEFHQEAEGSVTYPGDDADEDLLERDSWMALGSVDNLIVAGLSGSAFEAGGTLQSDPVYGGAVAAMPGAGFGVPDMDQRVLLAQVTTDGMVHFSANLTLELESGESTSIQNVQLTIPGAVPGCADPLACNFDADANQDDGSCQYEDALGDCGGDCAADTDDDGICDDDEWAGCTDMEAANYDPSATDDDGSCEPFVEVDPDSSGLIGLVQVQLAESGDGLLVHRVYAQFDGAGYELVSLFGTPEAPLMVTSEQGFYQSPDAGPLATQQPSTPSATSVNDSWLTIGTDLPNGANLLSVGMDFSAFEAGGNLEVDSDAGGALFIIPGSEASAVSDSTGRVLIAQLASSGQIEVLVNVKFIRPDGVSPEVTGIHIEVPAIIPGCVDSLACNFDPGATSDDGSCLLPDSPCAECADGIVVVLDADGDGICDADETEGCTDPEACNAGVFTESMDSLCIYPLDYPENEFDCDGNCVLDTDGDGVCDVSEIGGCTDALACNFSVLATDDDGSCAFPEQAFLDCDGNCLNDEDGDGVCDEVEYTGCTDSLACNFDPLVDPGNAVPDSCLGPLDVYGVNWLDCDGQCLNDEDGDGVCDEEEMDGCTYDLACNFDPSATEEDGSCVFAEPGRDCGGECLFDFNGDGTCDEPGMGGCTYPTADNYDASAPYDDGSCEFPSGDCAFDSNGDGSVNVTDLLNMLVALGATCP